MKCKSYTANITRGQIEWQIILFCTIPPAIFPFGRICEIMRQWNSSFSSIEFHYGESNKIDVVSDRSYQIVCVCVCVNVK